RAIGRFRLSAASDVRSSLQEAAGLVRARPVGWARLGAAYCACGEWSAALAPLQKAAAATPDNAVHDQLLLALAHGKLSHKDEAAQWFDRAGAAMKKGRFDPALRDLARSALIDGRGLPEAEADGVLQKLEDEAVAASPDRLAERGE